MVPAQPPTLAGKSLNPQNTTKTDEMDRFPWNMWCFSPKTTLASSTFGTSQHRQRLAATGGCPLLLSLFAFARTEGLKAMKKMSPKLLLCCSNEDKKHGTTRRNAPMINIWKTKSMELITIGHCFIQQLDRTSKLRLNLGYKIWFGSQLWQKWWL